MIVDTHTHLYMDDYDADRSEVMERARLAGVGLMVLPCVDENSLEPMLRMHRQWPDATALAIGIHPTEVRPDWRAQVGWVARQLRDNPGMFCAVGEVGIDLYHDASMRSEQRAAFEAQIALAADYGLPLLLHCREGLDDTLKALEPMAAELDGAVFHCFGGTEEEVGRIRRVMPDAMFGIGGIATFKKSTLPAVLPAIGIDHILLETDAPWLAPTPHRGKRNESAYLTHVAEAVGNSLGLSAEAVCEATTANARRFLHLDCRSASR